MGLTMAEIHDIRNKYFNEGKTISEISRDTQKDRKTIRKYLAKDNWNEDEPTRREKAQPSLQKLDPYKPLINEWLERDKKEKRKQRHTARRIYTRLVEETGEGFKCSYRTVAEYVKMKKKGIYKTQDGYLPLEHKAGEGQADFGDADFIENGTRYSGKYFVLSYPHSNGGYLQLFRGENLECLLEGLVQIFEYAGGACTEIWFDNASGIVKIMKNNGRSISDRFLRFQEHYGFEIKFCNPASGWEKGSVEKKVGYLRSNLLVPVPEFRNLQEYNKLLLAKCAEDMDREHYRLDERIFSLFEEDKKALLPLPRSPFDTAKYEVCRTNGYGRFFLENGLHEYSASPSYANTSILVQITANKVIPMNDSRKEIVVHKRLYGNTKQQSMQWLPYLTQLSRRPGALKYTGIYRMMPEPLQAYLDQCAKSDTGMILKTLAELTSDSSFENAVKTVESALVYGASDIESLLNLHRKLHGNSPELPPISLSESIPELNRVNMDFRIYDAMLRGAEMRPC